MWRRNLQVRSWPLILGLVIALLPLPVRAQDKAASVSFQVWPIRATRSDKEISKELEKLADALKKTFNYTGYKLLKTDTRSADLGSAATSSLPGGYKLTLTPDKKGADKITYKLKITERKGDKDVEKLNTTVSIAPEKFQLFGGSAFKLDGGDDLIIAISAK
jgi:hypothetical protein